MALPSRSTSVAVLLAASLLASPAVARAAETPAPDAPTPALIRGTFGAGTSFGIVGPLTTSGLRAEAGVAVVRPEKGIAQLLVAADVAHERSGLPARTLRLTGAYAWELGRLHLGGGPELSYFWMQRVASSRRDTIRAVGLGAQVTVGVDVLRFSSSRAVHLQATASAAWMRDPRDLLHFDRGLFGGQLALALGTML